MNVPNPALPSRKPAPHRASFPKSPLAGNHLTYQGLLARLVSVEGATDPIELGKRAIEASYWQDIAVVEFAAFVGLTQDTFARRFRARFGVSPAGYRVQFRLNRSAAALIERPDLSVRDILRLCGFRNHSYFHRLFHTSFGTTPLEYRERRTTTSPPPAPSEETPVLASCS